MLNQARSSIIALQHQQHYSINRITASPRLCSIAQAFQAWRWARAPPARATGRPAPGWRSEFQNVESREGVLHLELMFFMWGKSDSREPEAMENVRRPRPPLQPPPMPPKRSGAVVAANLHTIQCLPNIIIIVAPRPQHTGSQFPKLCNIFRIGVCFQREVLKYQQQLLTFFRFEKHPGLKTLCHIS